MAPMEPVKQVSSLSKVSSLLPRLSQCYGSKSNSMRRGARVPRQLEQKTPEEKLSVPNGSRNLWRPYPRLFPLLLSDEC